MLANNVTMNAHPFCNDSYLRTTSALVFRTMMLINTMLPLGHDTVWHLCVVSHTNASQLIFLFVFSRHFLFKTSTGTTTRFSTATPGYTMATSSVYCPPTRPLPRNTLYRSAFKFKKSSKYCSWRLDGICSQKSIHFVYLSTFANSQNPNQFHIPFYDWQIW